MDNPAGLQALVSVDEPYDGEIDAGWLEDVARAGLAAAGVPGAAQVSLLITGDETLRALNVEYRGLDEATDVLSFSAGHQGHWEGDGDGPEDLSGFSFILPPGEPEPLGEVIVSYPQAKRQADEQGVSLVRELAHLVVHGVLHLTGHDHVEPEETAAMQAKEQAALAELGTWEPVRP